MLLNDAWSQYGHSVSHNIYIHIKSYLASMASAVRESISMPKPEIIVVSRIVISMTIIFTIVTLFTIMITIIFLLLFLLPLLLYFKIIFYRSLHKIYIYLRRKELGHNYRTLKLALTRLVSNAFI